MLKERAVRPAYPARASARLCLPSWMRRTYYQQIHPPPGLSPCCALAWGAHLNWHQVYQRPWLAVWPRRLAREVKGDWGDGN